MDQKSGGRTPRKTNPRGPGGSPLTTERDLYLHLMSQGMSNSRACREVGVNRKTGTRWRHGRTILNSAGRKVRYAPISVSTDPAAAISPRFLSQDERVLIGDRLHAGLGIRAIAVELGRSPSTVSREVLRNSEQVTGRYRPFAAHRTAAGRRPRPKQRKLTDPALHQHVQKHLDLSWSPEQIAATLPAAFPDRPDLHVVHETIYQALYCQARPQALGSTAHQVPAVLHRVPAVPPLPTRALRTGRYRRRPRRRPEARRTRFAVAGLTIHDRPADVETRLTAGHWEGDLIVGILTRSAIATLVERTTGFTLLVHLPLGKTGSHLRDALLAAVAHLPGHLLRSLTWDQGSEMSHHDDITRLAGLPVYFCDPASPWQRGTNENANGLLRQYFPKGTDLSVHDADRLAAVAAELNDRPRKRHGWQTPAQLFATLLLAPA